MLRIALHIAVTPSEGNAHQVQSDGSAHGFQVPSGTRTQSRHSLAWLIGHLRRMAFTRRLQTSLAPLPSFLPRWKTILTSLQRVP